MKDIRLMLVDDHDIVRVGLKTFLDGESNLKVIAEAGTGSEAIGLIEQASPDVVIMDISMPGVDGIEATRRIKEGYPDCRVLILSVHEDKQYLFEVMAAGASGYITKHSVPDELVNAIHSVAAGKIYLQSTLARWLLEDYRKLSDQSKSGGLQSNNREEHAKDLEVLSKRELQVLELVSEGLTNPLIGERLGISHKTVARHRERIMNKLDLHSCAELVKFAVRTGLIDVF